METSRSVIMANLDRSGAARPGLSFDHGRWDDIVFSGPGWSTGYTQKRWTEGDFEYYDDHYGNIWRRMNGKDACERGEIYLPKIADWSDLADLQLPRFDRETVVNKMRGEFAREPDKYRVSYMPGWIFADARYLRRMDQYLLDMALYPEELDQLHQKLKTVYRDVIVAVAQAGADAIIFAEDMGTQQSLLFSPEMWDQFFREIYTELFQLAHEHNLKVMMHSCGQNRKILEPLLKAGVNCFQFDQPEIYDFADLANLLRQYRAVLYSPVDIQKVLPTGDRGLIEQEVDKMLQCFNGGLIFKNYPDLPGIGVKEEWDHWAYHRILEQTGLA